MHFLREPREYAILKLFFCVGGPLLANTPVCRVCIYVYRAAPKLHIVVSTAKAMDFGGGNGGEDRAKASHIK